MVWLYIEYKANRNNNKKRWFFSFEEAAVPVRRSARTKSQPKYNLDEFEDEEEDADGGVDGPGKAIYESVFLPGHDEEEEEVGFLLLEV